PGGRGDQRPATLPNRTQCHFAHDGLLADQTIPDVRPERHRRYRRARRHSRSVENLFPVVGAVERNAPVSVGILDADRARRQRLGLGYCSVGGTGSDWASAILASRASWLSASGSFPVSSYSASAFVSSWFCCICSSSAMSSGAGGLSDPSHSIALSTVGNPRSACSFSSGSVIGGPGFHGRRYGPMGLSAANGRWTFGDRRWCLCGLAPS